MAKKKSKSQRLSTNPFDALMPKKGKKKMSVFYANATPAPTQRGPRKKLPKAGKKKKSSFTIGHVRGVCSVTDPFCPAAKNSKWPDGTQGNTMTSQFRGSQTIATTANGNNAGAFIATVPFGYLLTSATTTTTATLAGSASTYQANSLLSTLGDEYRIVSMGIVARCVASANNCGGILTLGTTNKVSTGQVITLGQELYDEVEIAPIQPGMEISWISQPRGPTAREFRAQSGGIVTNDWTNLIFEISGAANSVNLINFEWYINTEWTTLTTNAVSTLARSNPPASQPAQSATSAVHSTLGSFVQGGVKEVEMAVGRAASSALTSLADDPFGSLASLFAML